MIKNYLKIAWRNLAKYRFISFVNIFGLTVGLTCCLLILTYILHEVSYDRFQPEADRTYRVTRDFMNVRTGARSLSLGSLAPAFGPLLRSDFGEIEDMTRILPNTSPMRYGDKMFNETNMIFADDRIGDFFRIDMVEGSGSRSLSEPYTMMMTDAMAKKYFGNEDPVNKVVRVNLGNYFDFRVTGVYKPFPSNTHLHPEIMLSFPTLRDTLIYGETNLNTSFSNNSFFTYIRLPKNYDPESMVAQFPAFLDRRMPPREGAQFRISQGTSLGLQKLTDIHLHSHTDLEIEENGDISRVYTFSAVALFILLIACINYMNLSTARSTLRAREIGIRKVSGAQKKEIMLQFLSESVLVSCLSMALAFLLTWLLLPSLNRLSGQQLSLSALTAHGMLPLIVLIPFIVGILSGLYPAAFMASFKPIKVLKGFLKTSGGGLFRKALVTVQFGISIVLIICTGVVFDQMRYMQNKSLGFNRDHIINLPYVTELNNQYDAFKNELMADRNIRGLTRSSRIPTGRLLDASNARVMSGDTLVPLNADVKMVQADEDFLPTYGVKMVAGRNFSRDFGTDTAAFVINEAAAKVLGFKSSEEAVGKNFGYGKRTGKLIGVYNDFHFESLHQKIVPLVVLLPTVANAYNNISIKMSGADMPATLAHVADTWKKFVPGIPYQFTFLDESFARLYQAEQRQKTIFTIFACIAIFLACLGLFGLSAFTISQRIREIGIRKVLGAPTGNIVTLLSVDFLKLVLLAALLAFPVAWLAMSKWLNDFAYRIDIPVWIFIAAGLLAAAIAFATIGAQALRAALANPVKNLRTE